MKLEKPQNENYAATVVTIKNLIPLAGCDNIIGTSIFGFQAIVHKDTKIGDRGLVFPAESQLSEEFARMNNLFRHSELNDNKEAKGYVEDNRRVKAMKFRGHRSDCLFMPLTSLAYIFSGNSPAFLEEGTTFDKIEGHEICRKYIVQRKSNASRLEKNKAQKKFIRVNAKFLPEHYDTENYFKNKHVIPDDRFVVVTQKLHGTSIRIGNTIVARKLKWRERIAQKLGVRVATTELDYVYGSRAVIKDANNPYQIHYYATDIWTEEGKKLEGVIPENFIVYGELVGWTKDGQPIQKNYTYCQPYGTCKLFVYRVAFVNGQGIIVDLSWEQVKEFCRDRGLATVPELWNGFHRDFMVDFFLDKRLFDNGFMQAVPLEPQKKLVDEGVCIRVDGIAPYFLKAKSPIFLQHETKMLDQEVVDLESDEVQSDE